MAISLLFLICFSKAQIYQTGDVHIISVDNSDVSSSYVQNNTLSHSKIYVIGDAVVYDLANSIAGKQTKLAKNTSKNLKKEIVYKKGKTKKEITKNYAHLLRKNIVNYCKSTNHNITSRINHDRAFLILSNFKNNLKAIIYYPIPVKKDNIFLKQKCKYFSIDKNIALNQNLTVSIRPPPLSFYYI